MSKTVSIVKKIALASLAMVVFFGLTAQTGERNTSKVKKLYEKEEIENSLKEYQALENMEITDNHLKNLINAKAKEECNEEIAKQADKRLGGVILTNKPINVIINECVQRKAPAMWSRKDEFKKNAQEEIKEAFEKSRKMLTLEGCREVAEKDKECTDDLIVRFDRFGTCICETY